MGEPLTEPRLQYWDDYRDDEDKGYFCQQSDGEFAAYLNWAAAADLQWSLFNLSDSYPFGSDIHIPYDGFAAPPPGFDAGERIDYNEICLVSDEKRAQYSSETRFLYLPLRSPYNPAHARLNVYVSRAEAYEAFVAIYDLRKTKTALLFDLIQLHYVEDAITPEDLQERIVDWPADQDIVPFLIEATASPYFRTRQFAAELLRKYPSPRSVAPLIALLTDTEDDVRSEAAETLGFLRATEAVPALCRAAGSPDSYLRTNVAEALGAIGVRSPEVAVVLLRLLGDENAVTRCFAAEALGDLRELSAKEALTTHVDDVPMVRVWACYALVRLGESLRWDVVTETLTDGLDTNERLQAAMVLYWLANEEGLAPRILSTLREARKTETSPEIIERLDGYIRNLTETAQET